MGTFLFNFYVWFCLCIQSFLGFTVFYTLIRDMCTKIKEITVIHVVLHFVLGLIIMALPLYMVVNGYTETLFNDMVDYVLH